jgi:hypothetical protein
MVVHDDGMLRVLEEVSASSRRIRADNGLLAKGAASTA